ncbi:TetR/AcrR family transcriptional regulator [Gordonia terrae]
MTRSEHAPTRNSERTRRAILDAASTLLGQRGTAATINEIAAQAGVSKSGLLHHFHTREELFLAVLVDALERHRQAVLEFVDLSENRPGKVLRAYVRALCGGSRTAMEAYAHSAMWSSIESIPGAIEALADDSRAWAELLAQDGLHPDRILVVRHAVEGLVDSFQFDPAVSEDTLGHARTVMLALIDDECWRPGGDGGRTT